MALTSDEETGGSNGINWLLQNHPSLIDGAFAINEGGYGQLLDGSPIAVTIQVAEKIFATFQVTARNPGGHSSLPRPDNAIYDLAEALLKIRDFEFPIQLTNTMRMSYQRQAKSIPGSDQTISSPYFRIPFPRTH